MYQCLGGQSNTLLCRMRAAATAQPDLPYFTSRSSMVLSELEVAPCAGPLLTHVVHIVPPTHHGIHGKVVVLGLQVKGVLVAHTDLRVTLQEQLFVVADPVEHLQVFI